MTASPPICGIWSANNREEEDAKKKTRAYGYKKMRGRYILGLASP